eukprot:g19350.t1
MGPILTPGAPPSTGAAGFGDLPSTFEDESRHVTPPPLLLTGDDDYYGDRSSRVVVDVAGEDASLRASAAEDDESETIEDRFARTQHRTRLGRGSFGEVWRALERTATGEYQEVVLKRLFTEKNDVRIRRSGEREIFFGVKLKHAPHVARYLDHFTTGENKDQLWLVFLNEGYSLLHLLWWVSADGTSIEPSPFWWSMKELGAPGGSSSRMKRDDADSDGGGGLMARGGEMVPSGRAGGSGGPTGRSLDLVVGGAASSAGTAPSFGGVESAASSWVVAYNAGGLAPLNEAALLPQAIPLPSPMESEGPASTATIERNGEVASRSPNLLPVATGTSTTVAETARRVLVDAFNRFKTALVGYPRGRSATQGGSSGTFSADSSLGRGASNTASGGSGPQQSPAGDGAADPILKSIIYQLLHGLAEIHAVGITHRDIKLGNLLIREEANELHLRVADFGSAVFRGRKAPANTTMHLFGADGPSALEETAAFDIFAAGLVFLEIVTGRKAEEILQVREVVPPGFTATTHHSTPDQLNQRKRRRLEMKYHQFGFSPVEIENALRAHAFTDNCIRPWLYTTTTGGGSAPSAAGAATTSPANVHQDETDADEDPHGAAPAQPPMLRPIVGLQQAQGRRQTQEDAVLSTKLRLDGTELTVVAVFDGHYGDEVAVQLRDTYPTQFLIPKLRDVFRKEGGKEEFFVDADGEVGFASTSGGNDNEVDFGGSSMSTGRNAAVRPLAEKLSSVVKTALRESLFEFDEFVSNSQETDAGSTLTLSVLFLDRVITAQVGDCELWMARTAPSTSTTLLEAGHESSGDHYNQRQDHVQEQGTSSDDAKQDLAIGQKVVVKATGELGKIEEVRETSSGARKMYLVLLQQRSDYGSEKPFFLDQIPVEVEVLWFVLMQIKRIAESHKPDAKAEYDRILGTGGFVSNYNNTSSDVGEGSSSTSSSTGTGSSASGVSSGNGNPNPAINVDSSPGSGDTSSASSGAPGVSATGALPRVMGKLATSRSIGKLPEGLKKHVSAEPDIDEQVFTFSQVAGALDAGFQHSHRSFLSDPNPKPSFLLIGSDGLFDAVSAHECCEIVEAVLRSLSDQDFAQGLGQKEVQEATQVLVETALQRGASDNVSVVLVKV